MVGGLGNAVRADHGVGEQSADRADDDEAAAAGPRHDFEPFAFKFLANLFAGLGFPAAKRNPGAGARQLFGNRLADAARSAGDERDLAVKVEKRGHLSFHYVKFGTTKLTCEGVPTEYRNAKHSAAFPTRIDGGEVFMGAPEPAVPLSQPAATFSYEHEGDRQFATTLARGLEVLRCFTPLEPLLGNKEISV